MPMGRSIAPVIVYIPENLLRRDIKANVIEIFKIDYPEINKTKLEKLVGLITNRIWDLKTKSTYFINDEEGEDEELEKIVKTKDGYDWDLIRAFAKVFRAFFKELELVLEDYTVWDEKAFVEIYNINAKDVKEKVKKIKESYN